MPLPIIAAGAGWSALVAWVASIVGGVVLWMSDFITKRLAITLVFIGVLVSIIATLKTALDALVSALTISAPQTVQDAIGMMPGNMSLCLSSVMSAYTLAWIMKSQWVVSQLKMKAYV
jgi:hypothetical protein